MIVIKIFVLSIFSGRFTQVSLYTVTVLTCISINEQQFARVEII